MPATSEEQAVILWMAERQRAAVATGVTLGHDILRHTFATHYVALTQDLGKAAKILGHYKIHTLVAHYDGVATKRQAREYFRAKP